MAKAFNTLKEENRRKEYNEIANHILYIRSVETDETQGI